LKKKRLGVFRLGGGSDFGAGGTFLASEAFMRHTGNFNLEWGYLAPAPSFLRNVRLVVVAATIAATVSAAVVFALVRQPAAEASVAARTLVQPVDVATAPKVAAAELQTQSGHASSPDAQHAPGPSGRESAPAVAQASASPSAASGSGIASTMPRAQVAAAATETSRVVVQTSAKTPNRKARAVAPAKAPAEASRVRVASAQHAVKPVPQRPAHSVVRDSVVPDINPDNGDLRDEDSLLARTKGVTDHVIAATHRAVSTIGVIPTWIGSIGNRLGG
jgi:hypothetical protein